MTPVKRTVTDPSFRQITPRETSGTPALSKPVQAGFDQRSSFASDEARRVALAQLCAPKADDVQDQLGADVQTAPEAGVHNVVPGDTLWDIARANGVPLQALIQANPQIQNPDLIFPGQRINLPAGASRPTAPTPTAPTPTESGADQPPQSSPVDGASATAPISGNATLNERAQAAVAFFESKGWSREQAAGIVANLIYESGGQLNHRQQQFGGGPGFGLAQWEGPRQADFQRVMGVDIRNSTFEQQLAFVQWELTNTEAAAGNALRRTGTAADAANVILRRYERPRDPDASQAERTRVANRLASGQPV